MNWKTKVQQNFDRQAEFYDDYSEIQADIVQSFIGDFPELGKAPKILEIGCGTGALTVALLRHYPDGKFFVTDISPAMLREAKKKVGDTPARVEWHVMDGEKIKLDEKFDLIISSMSVQWFEKPLKSLETLQSFLKPEGQLLYSVPGKESFKEWRDVLKECGFPVGLNETPDWAGVYREEENLVPYPSVYHFLGEIKYSGAATPHKGHKPLTRGQFEKACDVYQEKYGGKVTWHIAYGRLASKD